MKKILLQAFVDEMTGELGFGIVGLNTTDERLNSANEGELIAHDIIEHVNGPEQIGSIRDEMQALGASWFTRGQFHDLRRDSRGSAYSIEENLAADFQRMFRDWFQEREYLPIERTHRHDFDDDFNAILDCCEAGKTMSYRAELDDIDDDFAEAARLWKEYRAAALANMRIGARKAQRKYGTGHAANQIFWNIVEALKPYMKPDYPGQMLELRFDRDRAYCEEYYEQEEAYA